MLSALLPTKPMTDEFTTSNLENSILLKACGFIESHHARILNVTEGSLKLRVGHGALTRLLYDCQEDHGPIKVILSFDENQPVEADADEPKNNAPRVKHAAVKVSIVPDAIGWNREDFHNTARKLLWSLRYHFMAT